MFLRLKKFSQYSNLSKILSFFSLYCFMVIALTISIVSIMAFFHFQLNHDMSTIENWLQRNGWEVLFFVKLLSFAAIYKILSLRSIGTSFWNYLYSKYKSPDYYIFVVIVFLYFTVASIVNIEPSSNKTFILSNFVSYLGTVVFYFFDIFILFYLLDLFNELKNKDYYYIFFFTIVLFALTTYIAVPYARKDIYMPIIHFASMLYWMNLKKPNYSNFLVYLLFLVGPICALFGLDMIWRQERSLYVVEFKTPVYFVVVLWSLAYLYTFYIRRRREV